VSWNRDHLEIDIRSLIGVRDRMDQLVLDLVTSKDPRPQAIDKAMRARTAAADAVTAVRSAFEAIGVRPA
jgi:hypothetical protein